MILKDVLLHAFSTAVQQRRIAFLVYFMQLCIALTLGMQVYEVFRASIGHSLEINKLLNHYDHTVLTDFLKVHGASITPLIGQLRWIIPAWLLFSVFIDGGILVTTKTKTAAVQDFWLGGSQFFFPFLKITLIFLLMALAWTLLILLPLAFFLEPSLEYFDSEIYSIGLFSGLLLFYLLGLLELFTWSVLSRTVQTRSGAGAWKCIREARRIFSRNKRTYMTLIMGFGAFQLLLLAAYWSLDSLIGMTSPLHILVLFILQQGFVFLRIQVRQMIYAGVNYLSAPAV